MDGLKPNPKGGMAILENGADLDGKLLSAGVALPQARTGAFALKPANPRRIGIAAMRANRAIRPKERLNVGIGQCFIVEVRGRQVGGDGAFLSTAPRLAFADGCVK